MRVLHVYRSYYPDSSGGIEESIRQIALSTATLNVETRIFTLSPNPTPSNINFPEGKVYRAKSWFAPASCDLGFIGSFVLFSKLSKWADIIHYHFPWPFGDLLHLICAKNVPSIITYHSDIVRQQFLGYLYKPLMQKTLNTVSTIVATSPAYAKTSKVLSTTLIRKRLKIIPLGINEHSYTQLGDNKILKQLKLNNKLPYFLFIGVLRYYKGIDTLLKAATYVNAKIIVAGSLPKNNSIPTEFQNTVNKNTIFIGQITASEKVSLIKNCLAVILPSYLRSEAFGMVLVESSLFGKPMICCELGTGTSFVNKNGETGFVIPPKSPKDLAKAMNALLNNKKLVKKLGYGARKRYEKNFSGYQLGNAYFDIYKKVLNL